jgi:shikimate kinase
MVIFLVGLPGCGKSSLGKKLAHIFKYPFYDLDHLIENGEGAKITELFSIHGEEKFRMLENQYLQNIKDLNQAIVATGGGTPCFHNNMEIINSLGISIFLDVAPKSIAQRLSENGIAKRPILKGKTREEITLTLEYLRLHRLPHYSQCHITLSNPDIQFQANLLSGLK